MANEPIHRKAHVNTTGGTEPKRGVRREMRTVTKYLPTYLFLLFVRTPLAAMVGALVVPTFVVCSIFGERGMRAFDDLLCKADKLLSISVENIEEFKKAGAAITIALIGLVLLAAIVVSSHR